MHRTVIRLGGSLRGHCPGSLLQAGFQLPPSVVSAPLAAQTKYFSSRLSSTKTPVESSGQPPRFKRPEPASSAGTSTEVQDGNTQTDSPSMTAPKLEPAASAARPVGVPPPPHAPARPRASIPAQKPIDTSSKEYKQAASRYVRFVVAFPFLVVTSYFLYERLAPELKIRQLPPSSPAAQAPRPAN
ncbi:hypothetical protein N658DRAFT_490240 [Parathielavia hyrcaniae]|uniref:Transmembrane protein n=1 Tax=Parathielavia hyrcaniae TaxID=113614 RepID=A0AAN6SX49_9PEZI|nr:hypothetical protein N658DRAFT_490240 [Parathielavia hyrcaniae]